MLTAGDDDGEVESSGNEDVKSDDEEVEEEKAAKRIKVCEYTFILL